MIIDYKPELIHEHTAIGCVSEFLSDACKTLERTTKDINDFDLPIGSILSCLSNSHKLDYIRLVKNDQSKQKQIMQAYCVFRSILNSHFGMTRTPISV